MANEEFYLKQLLDGIKESIDDVKDTMSTQHVAFSTKLDILIGKNEATDRKADKAIDMAHEALKKTNDAQNSIEELQDAKKKLFWTMGGIAAGLGVAGGKIASFITGLFQ